MPRNPRKMANLAKALKRQRKVPVRSLVNKNLRSKRAAARKK